MKPKSSKAEPTAFFCERCAATGRTHMLEVIDGDLISFMRLCDRCLKREHDRYVKRGART